VLKIVDAVVDEPFLVGLERAGKPLQAVHAPPTFLKYPMLWR
jgi:hypothetical protein